MLASSPRIVDCSAAALLCKLYAQQKQPQQQQQLQQHQQQQQQQQQQQMDEQELLSVFDLLLSNLSDQVQRAQSDLLHASRSSPMQGTIHCLRIVIKSVDFRNDANKNKNNGSSSSSSDSQQWRDRVRSLIECARLVIDVSFPVVCNASPEGFVPESEEGEEFRLFCIFEIFVPIFDCMTVLLFA